MTNSPPQMLASATDPSHLSMHENVVSAITGVTARSATQAKSAKETRVENMGAGILSGGETRTIRT